MDFSGLDHEALAAAVRRLEAPSFAGRLAALAGKPVGLVQRALPTAATSAAASRPAKLGASSRRTAAASASWSNPEKSMGCS